MGWQIRKILITVFEVKPKCLARSILYTAPQHNMFPMKHYWFIFLLLINFWRERRDSIRHIEIINTVSDGRFRYLTLFINRIFILFLLFLLFGYLLRGLSLFQSIVELNRFPSLFQYVDFSFLLLPIIAIAAGENILLVLDRFWILIQVLNDLTDILIHSLLFAEHEDSLVI